MTPEVAVVVPTYQRADRLPRLVAALEAQTLEPSRFEVVVVDDGSTDETRAVLSSLAASTGLQLRALHLPTNRGRAAARNEGWRSTAAPLVAFTDDDCAPDPSWLAAGLAAAAVDARAGILQGRTRPETTPVRVWSHTRQVDSLTLLFEGCNLFVRREALERSGGFDERFVFSGEDTSMGWSILEAGFEARFAGDAVVAHDVTRPGFRRRLRQRAMEGDLVRVVRLHPGFRAEACWRPWAYRRENALFLLAAVSLLGASRRPALAAGAVPWLIVRWPGDLSRAAAIHLVKRWIDDSVGAWSMIRASVHERTLLL